MSKIERILEDYAHSEYMFAEMGQTRTMPKAKAIAEIKSAVTTVVYEYGLEPNDEIWLINNLTKLFEEDKQDETTI